MKRTIVVAAVVTLGVGLVFGIPTSASAKDIPALHLGDDPCRICGPYRDTRCCPDLQYPDARRPRHRDAIAPVDGSRERAAMPSGKSTGWRWLRVYRALRLK